MSRRRRAAAALGAGLVAAAGCATGAAPEANGRSVADEAAVVAPLPVEAPAAEVEQRGDRPGEGVGEPTAGEAGSAEVAETSPTTDPGSPRAPAASAAMAVAPPDDDPQTAGERADASTAPSPRPAPAAAHVSRSTSPAVAPPPTAELAGAREPTSSPSSSGGPGEATPTGAPVPPAAPRRDRPSEPVRQELIVVDEGTSAVRPSPGELARTTRREAAGRGSAPRITNDNLADYARRGQVTMSGTPVAEKPAAGEAAESAGEGEAGAAEPVRDEAWWRQRAREIREEWRRTVDEIGELEAAAADLRWRFYAEDDPWVRDGEVKPEWDRALDRLSDARRRLDEYPQRLAELVEEGRREGALPGWLREGIELEPSPEELPGAAADPAEPVEPREVDERGQGDGR